MMKVKIDKIWDGMSDQRFYSNDGTYLISNLIEKAKDLPVFDLPLFHIDLFSCYFEIKGMRSFVAHMKHVQAANLDYPIILDNDGGMMDGRHRIAKALLLGKETIKAKRFIEYVAPDFYDEEE